MIKLSPADEKKLIGVHPDLIKVVRQAATISGLRFIVIQGARSTAEQARNLAKGVSQTSRSRHVRTTSKNGFACAVDLAPVLADGKTIPWKQWNQFAALNVIMMRAAADVKIPIEWGGNWKTIKDGDHWQLPWKQYP